MSVIGLRNPLTPYTLACTIGNMKNNETFQIGQQVTDGRTDYYGGVNVFTIVEVRQVRGLVNGKPGTFPVYYAERNGTGTGPMQLRTNELRPL